jgi:hypothetical protein
MIALVVEAVALIDDDPKTASLREQRATDAIEE